MRQIDGGNSERCSSLSSRLIPADMISLQFVLGRKRMVEAVNPIGNMLKPVSAICHMQKYVTVGHEYEEANGRH